MAQMKEILGILNNLENLMLHFRNYGLERESMCKLIMISDKELLGAYSIISFKGLYKQVVL